MTLIEDEFDPVSEWTRKNLTDRDAKPDMVLWSLAQLLRSLPREYGLWVHGIDIRASHIVRALEEYATTVPHLETELRRLEQGTPKPTFKNKNRIKFIGGSY